MIVGPIFALTGMASMASAQQGYDLLPLIYGDSQASVEAVYNAQPGDTFTILYQDGQGVGNVPQRVNASVTADGTPLCSNAGCDGAVYTAPAQGTATLLVSGLSSPGTHFQIYVECRGLCTRVSVTQVGGGSGGGAGGGSGSGTTTTQTAQQAASRAAATAGASATSAAGSAIGSAVGARSGGGGARVSTQGLFLTTAGETTNASWWGNIAGQQFSGALDGQGGEITLGVDWELGGTGTLLGVAMSYGKYKITSGGTTFETDALAIGPYISTALTPNVDLNAWTLVARPDYEGGGATYTSRRVMGGVDVGLDYTLGGTQATGYLELSGFTERLPGAAPGGARTITQAKASIGSRFEFAPQAAVRPSLSIGADAIRFDDGTTRIESLSPRLGLGLEADAGPGTLSIKLDAGEIFDKARSTSLGLRYTASF